MIAKRSGRDIGTRILASCKEAASVSAAVEYVKMGQPDMESLKLTESIPLALAVLRAGRSYEEAARVGNMTVEQVMAAWRNQTERQTL